MKKICVVILLVGIFGVLIGCSQNNETPTNISSQQESPLTSVVSQDETSSVVAENKENPQNQESATVVAENKENPQNQESATVSSKETTSKESSSQVENNEPVKQKVEFTTEAGLGNWLKNQENVKSGFSEDVFTIMQQGNTIVYFKPMISSDNGMLVFKNAVVALTGIHYYYQFVDNNNLELRITAHHGESDVRLYNTLKSGAENKKSDYYIAQVNGIEYFYKKKDLADETVFAWKQYGQYHSALLDGHFEQIDEILPLLKLEQVTVRMNDDSVTQ